MPSRRRPRPSLIRPLASLALAASSAASLAAVPAAHAATLMADVGEDIFASTGVGPALCVVGTIYIGYVVFSGYETIKRLKEELTDMGYDVEEFNRVGRAQGDQERRRRGYCGRYLRQSVVSARLPRRCVRSIVDVQKVQAYWKTRRSTCGRSQISTKLPRTWSRSTARTGR